MSQNRPNQYNETEVKPLKFQDSLRLEDVGFRYTEDGPWVLRRLNLEIHKGSQVGIVGSSGSGKTTLLDIIMGLLLPTEGKLLIDNHQLNQRLMRSWQLNIAHVPQVIHLSDTTISENIAFGVPAETVNINRVRQAAQMAHLDEIINSWKNGYETLVGERGVQLSGGQRQRIGIARALYKNAGIVVFDEATNSLDSETESSVMQVIDSLKSKVTVLIVAHRLNTLKNCDYILRLTRAGVEKKAYSDL